jgi:4-hydroxy-3-polyprenylbenzoate decarboxylase
MTGLPIPATAEIAIEGKFYPGETGKEGPFGEFTGYYSGGERPEPVARVEALYYRDDPILCGHPPGRPPSDAAVWQGFMRAGAIWTAVERAGVPDVQGVWCHVPGGNFFIAIAIKQRNPGHAKQAASVAANCHPGAYMGRYVVVVDDDIDVSNIDDVLWAMATRVDPARDISIQTDCWSSRLDPAIEPGSIQNSRALINACRPYHRLATFPKVSGASPDLLKSVREKWLPELLNGASTG